MEKYANFDSLTELPNRRKWDKDSIECWCIGQKSQIPMTFGIIDIDYFKKYNDRYGHQQGDIALRRIANTINRVLFSHNGRIFRCGGEEFYFYLTHDHPHSNIDYVLDECIASIINLNIEHKGSLIADIITVSIGAVRIIPNDCLNLNSVMKCADQQLYQIKNSTRNDAKVVELNQDGLPI